MKMPAFKSYLLFLAFCPSAIVRCLYEPYGENVALNKPASQSSTYEEDRFMFNASLGVDGKRSTDMYHDKTCSHTNAWQTSAWWTVNLNGLFFIKFIRIYQLIEHNSYKRLDGSEIYVQVEDSKWQHIQLNSSHPPEMLDVNVTLDKRISSIKLNNTKLTKTNEAFVSICELEAYEVLACSPYIVRNGRVEVVKLGDSKQNFTYGTQLNVACENGYHMSENRSSLTEAESITECMGTKTWSRNFTCSADPAKTRLNVVGVAGGGTAAGLCVIIVAIVVTVVFVRRGNVGREDKSSDKAINDVQRTYGKREEEQRKMNSTKNKQIYGQGSKEEDIACPEPDVRMGPAYSNTIHGGDIYEIINEEPHRNVIEMSEYLEPTFIQTGNREDYSFGTEYEKLHPYINHGTNIYSSYLENSS